jgi:signal transduction histidine kinase
MKGFRRIVITYILLMLAALIVLINMFNGIDLKSVDLGDVSDKELGIYKDLWGRFQDSVSVNQAQILKIIIMFWAAVFVIGLLLLVLIYLTELKPIGEMESFANEIAKGNLDVPLPVHKNKLFINFVESFDIMRLELKAAKEREAASERAKRELVGELSHDIKTPVATIQATCEVLELKYGNKLKESDDEEVSNLLDKIGTISTKAETINALVNNMFKATLEDSEEIRFNVLERDSKDIEVYFKNLVDYGNIILDNHIPECLLYYDSMRMEQVIDNIIGNSYKYAHTDIHVSFEEVIGSGNEKFIKIKIKDSGPGVLDDELPLIVEKFYRGKGTDEKSGYGLGMYLANWYMTKQGGGMEYYNEGGFVVELFVKKV